MLEKIGCPKFHTSNRVNGTKLEKFLYHLETFLILGTNTYLASTKKCSLFEMWNVSEKSFRNLFFMHGTLLLLNMQF